MKPPCQTWRIQVVRLWAALLICTHSPFFHRLRPRPPRHDFQIEFTRGDPVPINTESQCERSGSTLKRLRGPGPALICQSPLVLQIIVEKRIQIWVQHFSPNLDWWVLRSEWDGWSVYLSHLIGDANAVYYWTKRKYVLWRQLKVDKRSNKQSILEAFCCLALKKNSEYIEKTDNFFCKLDET